MMLSARDLNDVISLMRIKILYFLSIRYRLFVSEAQLSVIIHTPSVDLVVVIEIKRMKATAEYVLRVLCACLLDFERLFVLVPCFELTTDFSGVSIAPSIHLLALCQCHRMLCSACDFLDANFRVGIEYFHCNARGSLHFARRLTCDHVLNANR